MTGLRREGSACAGGITGEAWRPGEMNGREFKLRMAVWLCDILSNLSALGCQVEKVNLWVRTDWGVALSSVMEKSGEAILGAFRGCRHRCAACQVIILQMPLPGLAGFDCTGDFLFSLLYFLTYFY